MSRARRAGRLVTASRQHQLDVTSATISSPRLITVVKKAFAPSILFGDDVGDDDVVEEGRAAILDLVAERDPQVARDRFGRGEAFPIAHHRFLHPFQIDAVVDMAHVVDVGGQDADRVMISFAGHGRNAVFH